MKLRKLGVDNSDKQTGENILFFKTECTFLKLTVIACKLHDCSEVCALHIADLGQAVLFVVVL